MNINYAHFGVLSKDITVLKREKTTNLASFMEPIGEDKNCFFALPAFHLYTDVSFVKKNTDFCFELLNQTLAHLQGTPRQEALLFCLEVAGNFSIKANDQYQEFKPQLLKLTNEHLELSFYKINKGVGLRSGHITPDLNSLLMHIFNIFVQPIKSLNNPLPDQGEAKKLLDSILTLKNKDMVFIPTIEEEFLIGSGCFSCFKTFIDCVIDLNGICQKPIEKNKIKDLILSSILNNSIAKGEKKTDWVDIKDFLDVKSALQTSFFIQKPLFFEDYIWGVLDSHQDLFKINPAKLYKIARNEAAYGLQRDKEMLSISSKKLEKIKIDYQSLEGYMSYFNYNQSVKNTHQWSPGHSIKAYMDRAIKAFNRIKKSDLFDKSQLQSLIDRSFIDVIVSLGREKKHKQALEIAHLCEEPLKILLDDNCKLTEFIHSGDDGFFNLFLTFLIDKKLINPFNCNAINIVEISMLEKTLDVLKSTHQELFTQMDKKSIENHLDKLNISKNIKETKTVNLISNKI